MSRKVMAKSKNRSVAHPRKSRSFSGNGNELGGINWRLPSGVGLAEFALRFGFLAPPLLGSVGERLKEFDRYRGFR